MAMAEDLSFFPSGNFDVSGPPSMSIAGKPENAALRQASVRNWQGCKRVAPHSRACASWGPTGPRQASLDPQPRLLHRALFLVEEGGALERPPVSDAAKSLACASHYLGLRGAFATLARQDWTAVAEWLAHPGIPRYI